MCIDLQILLYSRVIVELLYGFSEALDNDWTRCLRPVHEGRQPFLAVIDCIGCCSVADSISKTTSLLLMIQVLPLYKVSTCSVCILQQHSQRQKHWVFLLKMCHDSLHYELNEIQPFTSK